VAGLFALGIAAMARHTAGAIGAYVFVLLVLPIIVSTLPSSIGNQIARLLTLSIGAVMTGNSVPSAFGPWTELAILRGYATLTVALGMILLVRRDA
jgi:ABC-2 type transport system permease protein